MKKLIILCITSLYPFLAISKTDNPNVLLIDSSFTPITLTSGEQTPDTCLLINENNIEMPQTGPCYDQTSWNNLKSVNMNILKGLQDFLSENKSSEAAQQWIPFQKSNKDQADQIRNQYIVATHGSRSAFILDKYSNGDANILFMRNMTTGIGGVGSETGNMKNRKSYTNGCGFNNWSSSDMKSFEKNMIQPYQEGISKTLTTYKSIKIVNLSLGYKHSWIQEDNPKCTEDQVLKEYKVLIHSWKNLINKHANVLFIVASGNENENFDDPKFMNNDLWANISSFKLKNLLLVGSMNRNGTKYQSSNFGKVVEVMALGENLPLNSPIPNDLKGHPTTVRGTSFSTPLVSAKAATLMNKHTSTSSLRVALIELFHQDQKKNLIETYLSSCKNINNIECLNSIISIISGPFLWDNTEELFLKGKQTWNFSPFPVQVIENLNSQAKVKLIEFNKQYIPALLLGEADSPYDLLLTLHHEIYHYSTYSNAAQYFSTNDKINNCVTRYQFELAKDELPAFKREIDFYNKAPLWFKNGANKSKFDSKLLNIKNISYSQYYKLLKEKIDHDNNFIVHRYIDLGEYPKCMRELI